MQGLLKKIRFLAVLELRHRELQHESVVTHLLESEPVDLNIYIFKEGYVDVESID